MKIVFLEFCLESDWAVASIGPAFVAGQEVAGSGVRQEVEVRSGN